MNKKGKLIVFEGIDGTGKSTQLELLANRLKKEGLDIITTKEPTDGVFGQKIRQSYLKRNQTDKEEELRLFIDDRREHVWLVLKPALEKGQIILCDRYFLSTAAYQGAIGFNPQHIIKQNSFAPNPDLAFIFQLRPEKSIKRIISSRGERPNDFEQNLDKVKQIFDKMDYPYIKKIEAGRSIEIIHQEVYEEVKKLLNNWL